MTHLLKGLFIKSKKKKDTAIFHCSDCGNDFKAHRQITREDFDDNDMAITTTYFPMKCPKCGNLATTTKSIQHYRVPCSVN